MLSKLKSWEVFKFDFDLFHFWTFLKMSFFQKPTRLYFLCFRDLFCVKLFKGTRQSCSQKQPPVLFLLIVVLSWLQICSDQIHTYREMSGILIFRFSTEFSKTLSNVLNQRTFSKTFQTIISRTFNGTFRLENLVETDVFCSPCPKPWFLG